jgi:ABC-type uncharacterized transport system permease subunit
MNQLLPVLIPLVPVVYALAWADYALLFFRDLPLARRTVTPSLVAAAGLHLLTLFVHAAVVRRCPMGNLPEILSVLVLSVVGVYLVLETRQANRYTGVFLLALVVPVTVISLSIPVPTGPANKLLKSPLFGMHTGLALLGYAAFNVCAAYGVMFLLLRRALKRQAFGLIFQRLPSLDGMAEMTVTAAVIGFAALTLTIGVGMYWGLRAVQSDLLHVTGGFWRDPKIYFTFAVWAVFGLAILVRYVLRWSYRAVVLILLAGFVLAVLAVIALNTWVHTFHRFTT